MHTYFSLTNKGACLQLKAAARSRDNCPSESNGLALRKEELSHAVHRYDAISDLELLGKDRPRPSDLPKPFIFLMGARPRVVREEVIQTRTRGRFSRIPCPKPIRCDEAVTPLAT